MLNTIFKIPVSATNTAPRAGACSSAPATPENDPNISGMLQLSDQHFQIVTVSCHCVLKDKNESRIAPSAMIRHSHRKLF